MADDIVARLRSQGEGCTCNAWGGYECACGAEWGDNYVLEAADVIERLQEEAEGERAMSHLFESLAQEAAEEIARLQEEVNDLRLQIVTLSIPKENHHG